MFSLGLGPAAASGGRVRSTAIVIVVGGVGPKVGGLKRCLTPLALVVFSTFF